MERLRNPGLVVVPPTPIGYNNPSPSTTASSSPDLSPDLSRLTPSEQERDSSETTIFTIYSMYSDDGAKGSDEGMSKGAVAYLGSSLSNGRNHKNGNSAYRRSHQPTNSDMYDSNSSDSNGHSSSNYMSAAEQPARSSLISNGSVHLSYLDDRPLSIRSSSSGLRDIAHKSSDTLRSSKFTNLPSAPNTNNITSYAVAEVPRDSHLQPTPSHSRPSSRQAVSRNGYSPAPSWGIPTPPRIRTPDLLSPPKILASTPPQRFASPGSKSSLLPSEGEEVDAFYVRNTYAELEMTGVKGDGYVEGVERTRARTGGSRTSMLREEQALGDGTEKSKELSPKELETLASLDR